MTPRVPRYSMEEFARRGKEIYARVVRPTLSPDDIGKLVMIDIESEDFEVDTNEFAAIDRLLERRPDAQTWLERAGYQTVDVIGSTLQRRDQG